VTIDESMVRTVVPDFNDEIAYWNFAQSGPLATFTGFSDTKTLYLADLSTGSASVLATASNREVLGTSFSGDEVVWVDGESDGYRNFIPCGNQGGVDWKIRLTNVVTDETRTIASGRNTLRDFCAASAPRVAIDSNLVAFATEDPRGDRPKGWKIVVMNVDDGSTVRLIETDHEVFDLALDHGDVAYVEGTYPKGGDFWPDKTWLVLNSANDAVSVTVDENIEEFSFREGRIAWYRNGNNEPGHLMTAIVADTTPIDLGPAVWTAPLTTGPRVYYRTEAGMAQWDASTGHVLLITGMSRPDAVLVNDGWMVWVGRDTTSDLMTPFVSGFPLSAIDE
jgi:hypothetical protein